MTWADVKSYTLEEYSAGRITGKEYSSFVLGALQTQMQIDADANIKTANASLINAQIQTEASKKALLDQQKLSEVQQTAKLTYEVLTLLPADAAMKNSQKALLDQQKLSEVQQTAKLTYEVLTLLPADAAMKNSQKALLDQQKLSEVERTGQELYKKTTLLPDQHDETVQKNLMVAAQTSMTTRQTTAFDDKRRVEKAEKLSNAVGMIYASGGTVPVDAWTSVKDAANAI